LFVATSPPISVSENPSCMRLPFHIPLWPVVRPIVAGNTPIFKNGFAQPAETLRR
jgi:acyl-CoA reductase-like NAD-dependent aldehyde dehydrogenase